MKCKGFFSMLLALVTCMSMIGCTNTQSTETVEGDNSKALQDTSGKATDGLYVSVDKGGDTTDQFSILCGWTSDSPDDTIVQKTMREELGIDYVCEFMQNNDYLTTLNLKLSSNADLPDIMIFPYNKTVENALVSAGRVMNLNDVYTSSKLTNIPAIDSRLQDYIKDTSGDMWYIPGYYAMEYDEPWGGWTVDAYWIRTDLMKEAGVTQDDLSTIEGFEDALRKFSQLKDANGNNIIPLSFAQGANNNHEERLILATFGVDTANGVSGMPSVKEENGEFIFQYDDPNYKEAYKWINKMYREGLIDMECTTMGTERFSEKIGNGQVAAFTTDLWISNLNETWKSYDSGEDNVTYYFEPFQSPVVKGIDKGYTSYVNPNPGYMVFINKDTKHLNAVLNWLEWCNEQDPYRQQEINEGPRGVNWDFVEGAEEGTWDFEASYKAERDSGDSSRVNACTPQLWQFCTYSNLWYPWFTQSNGSNLSGAALTSKYCKYIGSEIINHRPIKELDQVKVDVDSVISENIDSMNAVINQYTAKMIMAKSDDDFEKYYQEFQKQLDLQANWSGMKEEWMSLYKTQFGK